MTVDQNQDWVWDPYQITDAGERVSHLYKDFFYYAHLSIYRFALDFCQGADVLDAGCGSGYGSAYLRSHGARSVTGVDASSKAIAFCNYHFAQPGLHFQAANLEQLDFAPASFDFIYSSNVLEHVPNVNGFMRCAHQLLKPGGSLLLAVPPITSDYLEYLNLVNPYHVNIWTPRQWMHTLEQFFGHIQPYLHLGCMDDDQRQRGVAEGSLDENSFDFISSGIDPMYTRPTLSAVFLAQHPVRELPSAATDQEFVEGSYTRLVGVIPPARRQRLQQFFEAQEAVPPTPLPPPTPAPTPVQMARNVWREAGLGEMVRKTLAWPFKKARGRR